MKKENIHFRSFVPGLLMSLLGSFMITLYAPVQQYIRNADDFIYDIYDLLRMIFPVWLAVFLVAFALFCLIRIISEKLYSWTLGISLWIVLSMYAEGNFLSGFLPTLTGKGIDWTLYPKERMYSVILWILVAATVTAAVLLMKRERFLSLASYVGGFGTVMLVLTLVFSLSGTAMRAKEDFYASGKNMFELSEDRNLVIFVLDEIDGDDFNNAITAHPEYKDTLKDFTFYRNTLGAYPGTKWAIPYMISGVWFENQEGFYKYREHAYVNSPVFAEMRGQGFVMGNYDEELPPAEPLIDFFENLAEPEKDSFMYPSNFRKMQLMLTGLQYLPFDLKRFCVLTPDNIYYDSLKETSGEEPFLWGNDLFLEKLSSEGVSLIEAPCFRMFHLQGVHDPFDYQLEMAGDYSGTYEDAMDVCVKLIGEYVAALKEAGIYDNTSIVVTGDHGHRPNVLYNMNPALFIKGMNEQHDFTVSDAPISHEDFVEAFLRLIDGKNEQDIFDAKEGDVRERRFLSTYIWDDDHIVEFSQLGDAKNVDNLTETGNVFTPSA
ncbi:MAG: sulfatase-like hydrolase/transferase [Eubacteriales bacterium]|nr:sulfatase-like hydrolase/transferase [Eubacteriales bacterium]